MAFGMSAFARMTISMDSWTPDQTLPSLYRNQLIQKNCLILIIAKCTNFTLWLIEWCCYSSGALAVPQSALAVLTHL